MRSSPFKASYTRTSTWLVGSILALPIKFFYDVPHHYFNLSPELFWLFYLVLLVILVELADKRIGSSIAVTVTNNGIIQDNAKVDFAGINKIVHHFDFYSNQRSNHRKLWCYIYHPDDEFKDERDEVYIDITDMVRMLMHSPLNQWNINRWKLTMSRGMFEENFNISYEPLGKDAWENSLLFRFCFLLFIVVVITQLYWQYIFGFFGLVALIIVVLQDYDQVKVTLSTEGVSLMEGAGPERLWSDVENKKHYVRFSDIVKVEKGVFRTKITTKNGKTLYFPQACFLLPELIMMFSNLEKA